MLYSVDPYGVVSYVPLTWLGSASDTFVLSLQLDAMQLPEKPALIALSNKDVGGLHKLWFMNLTLFPLLVLWYETKACSVVSLLTNWEG